MNEDTQSIAAAMADAAQFATATLDALLPKPAGPEARLHEAMRKAMLSEGRRLRAFLVLQTGRLFGVDPGSLGRIAAAVECVHAYARLHEDVFTHDKDDATIAILAGDALLTLTFGLLVHAEAHGDPFVRCELVAKLSQSSGYGGMVGGRVLDIAFDGQDVGLPEITRLQRMKTAALITFCCEAGAIMGKASGATRQALAAYGQELGLAFQIAEDLRAVEQFQGETHDPAIKESRRGKATVVSVLGVERAWSQAEALASQAAAHLDLFDDKADLLRAAAQFCVARNG